MRNHSTRIRRRYRGAKRERRRRQGRSAFQHNAAAAISTAVQTGRTVPSPPLANTTTHTKPTVAAPWPLPRYELKTTGPCWRATAHRRSVVSTSVSGASARFTPLAPHSYFGTVFSSTNTKTIVFKQADHNPQRGHDLNSRSFKTTINIMIKT